MRTSIKIGYSLIIMLMASGGLTSGAYARKNPVKFPEHKPYNYAACVRDCGLLWKKCYNATSSSWCHNIDQIMESCGVETGMLEGLIDHCNREKAACKDMCATQFDK